VVSLQLSRGIPLHRVHAELLEIRTPRNEEAHHVGLPHYPVATDFSESSKDVGFVETLRHPNAAMYVARLVVPDPLNLPWVVEGAGMDFIELQRTWMADARRELTQLLTARAVDPAKVKGTVALGTPAVEVIRHAAQWKADLIVVGSHGRGTMGRLLLGSVAEGAARGGCP
jgi:nucleotide-binding universal stress UspA family protein